MPDHAIFDCWTSYGPRPGKDPEERWTLDHLLQDMDFYGVASALVRHEQGYYYDPMYCNARLLHEIASHRDRLTPCWEAIPHQCGDFLPPSEFARRMDGENIKAVSIRPARYTYPIHESVLNSLAEVLNSRHTLILTTLPDLCTSFDSAVRFCNVFSECPVIIADAYWSNWRTMVAIMDACPNARIELHLFQGNRSLEWFSERYGIERVLFGSGLLKHSAGAARSFVDWPMIPEDQVARFAGGNLAKLLGVQPASSPSIPPNGDEIILAAREGKPVPVPVFDAHCHVLHEGLNGAGVHYVMPHGDFPHMLELNKRIGIDVSALMSWNAPFSMDIDVGNGIIERLLREYPEDVIALSTCDPNHQTREEIEAMCRRLYLELGFRGMKPYCTNGLNYSSEAYDPFWNFCNEHRLYGLLHIDARAGGLDAVDELAGRFPDATFVVAHSGGSWPLAREVQAVGAKHPNVVAELTYTPVLNGIVEWLCANMGPDRVLFGTDAPMRDPRPQLGWCIYTHLSTEQKQKILGENYARLLRRGLIPGKNLPGRIIRNA